MIWGKGNKFSPLQTQPCWLWVRPSDLPILMQIRIGLSVSQNSYTFSDTSGFPSNISLKNLRMIVAGFHTVEFRKWNSLAWSGSYITHFGSVLPLHEKTSQQALDSFATLDGYRLLLSFRFWVLGFPPLLFLFFHEFSGWFRVVYWGFTSDFSDWVHFGFTIFNIYACCLEQLHFRSEIQLWGEEWTFVCSQAEYLILADLKFKSYIKWGNFFMGRLIPPSSYTTGWWTLCCWNSIPEAWSSLQLSQNTTCYS